MRYGKTLSLTMLMRVSYDQWNQWYKKTSGNGNIYLMPNITNNFLSKAVNIIRQKENNTT